MTTKPRAKKPSRKPPRASRPFHASIEPDIPAHMRAIILTMVQAIAAGPAVALLPLLYLIAARALIREAERLQKAGM